MPLILGIVASGNYPRVTNSYESIATVTVGAGGSSTITFSSIPSTYKHLQIRGIARTSTAGSGTDALFIQLNNDTTYTNYRTHLLYGDGASAGATSVQSSSYPGITYIDMPQGSETTNAFGTLVCDLLDYKETTKNKVARTLSGYDGNNTNGTIRFSSTVWLNTAAVTSIDIKARLNSFVQYSQFALYGIKG